MMLRAIHDFEVALLEPCLAMTTRGLRVDDAKRRAMLADIDAERGPMAAEAERVALAVLAAHPERIPAEKAHLFVDRRVCSCCRNGKAKRAACWACAGFEAKPTKKALGDKTLATCIVCDGVGAFTAACFSPSSPQQVAVLLYDVLKLPKRTQGGKVTTDEEALKSLLAEAKPDAANLIRSLLRLGKLDTIASVLERIAPGEDGKIRTVYNPAGTVSGRFASAESFLVKSTNLSNLPKREAVEAKFDVKACFVPDPGMVFVEADLSGAEAWIAAACAGDTDLLDKLRNGFKIHEWTAAYILTKMGKPTRMEDVTKEGFERQVFGKVPRHCVDAETEALTLTGWKRIATLLPDDQVLQWSTDGTLKFVTPAVHRYDGPTQFHEFAGRGLMQRVTGEHRMPYVTNGTLKVGTPTTLPRGASLPTSGEYSGDMTLPDALMRLIVATQADGSYPGEGRSIVFHFRKTHKVERLTRLLQELGADVTSNHQRADGSYYIAFRGEVAERVRNWLTLKKTFDWRLLDLSGSSLDVLLDEVTLWDGGRYAGNSKYYFTAIRENAEVVATLANLRNRQGLLREVRAGGYTVSFNRRQFADADSLKRRLMNNSDGTYCVTVPSGFFLMRHSGSISVTGNSLSYGMQANTLQKEINFVADITGIAVTLRQSQLIYGGYHELHPTLQAWWRRVLVQLSTGTLTTTFGRRRTFYGRGRGEWLSETHKSGIAQEPQSTIADLLNRGLLRWWRQYDGKHGELLAQVYDSVLIQTTRAKAALTANLVRRCLTEEIEVHGVKLTIPVDVKILESWAVLPPAPAKVAA